MCLLYQVLSLQCSDTVGDRKDNWPVRSWVFVLLCWWCPPMLVVTI